jgi:hypothetical protein
MLPHELTQWEDRRKEKHDPSGKQITVTTVK